MYHLFAARGLQFKPLIQAEFLLHCGLHASILCTPGVYSERGCSFHPATQCLTPHTVPELRYTVRTFAIAVYTLDVSRSTAHLSRNATRTLTMIKPPTKAQLQLVPNSTHVAARRVRAHVWALQRDRGRLSREDPASAPVPKVTTQEPSPPSDRGDVRTLRQRWKAGFKHCESTALVYAIAGGIVRSIRICMECQRMVAFIPPISLPFKYGRRDPSVRRLSLPIPRATASRSRSGHGYSPQRLSRLLRIPNRCLNVGSILRATRRYGRRTARRRTHWSRFLQYSPSSSSSELFSRAAGACRMSRLRFRFGSGPEH